MGMSFRSSSRPMEMLLETKKSLLLNIVYEILRIHFLYHPYEMGVFSYASLTWTCAHYKDAK